MARLTLDDLLAKCGPAVRALNAPLFQAHGAAPAPVPEPRDRDGTLAASAPQKSHPGKRLVRVKSYRVRLLDEDNLVAKWHVDALRYAGVLHGDDPSQARIQIEQEKVRTKKEERTEITVDLVLD